MSELSKMLAGLKETVTAFGGFEAMGFIRIEHLNVPNWREVLAEEGYDVTGFQHFDGHLGEENCFIVKVDARWLWDHEFYFIPLFGGVDNSQHKKFEYPKGQKGKKVYIKYSDDEQTEKIIATRKLHDILIEYFPRGDVAYNRVNVKVTLRRDLRSPFWVMCSNPQELLWELNSRGFSISNVEMWNRLFGPQGSHEIAFPTSNNPGNSLDSGDGKINN